MSVFEDKPGDQTIAEIVDLKQRLKKPTFHMTERPDGIIVFAFDNLTREVLVPWADFIQAQQDKWQEPLRIMYDFRGAGAPSRFMIDRVPKILEKLEYPEDIRTAFLFDDGLMARFTRNALQALPDKVGIRREFMNLDPAVNWLLEGVNITEEDDENEE